MIKQGGARMASVKAVTHRDGTVVYRVRYRTGGKNPVVETFYDAASAQRFADLERSAVFVKAGEGSQIVREGSREGHEYEMLGSLRGEHKRLECLLVTLTEKSVTQPLFQHPGTEFIYMLDGSMDYAHSRSVYRLSPGDSLQLDGEGAHGPVELVELPIRFLSVIAFPDSAI